MVNDAQALSEDEIATHKRKLAETYLDFDWLPRLGQHLTDDD
jgi:hypothetical protein